VSEELFDGEFYKRLASIKLNVKVRLSQGLSGSRKSTAKGSSLEFSDFRDYLLGDDIRYIDWNAYGRSGKLLVKLFQEEKEGRFHIFVDGSRSMDFGEAKKSVQALRIAAALSYVILANLDRVYLTTGSGKGYVTSKGLTGRQAFEKMIRQLKEAAFTGKNGLEQMVYGTPFGYKGVSVLISDFFLEQDIKPLLAYLSFHKQQIILVQVLSPEEQAPELDGTLNLLDSEDGRNLKVTMDAKVTRAYSRAYEEFTGHLKGLCRKYQASYVFASSDTPLDKFFLEAFGK